jgi:cobalamin biosynthesis protein CobD/CbiB
MTCAVDEAVLYASHQAEKEIHLAKFRRPVGEEGNRSRRSRHVNGPLAWVFTEMICLITLWSLARSLSKYDWLIVFILYFTSRSTNFWSSAFRHYIRTAYKETLPLQSKRQPVNLFRRSNRPLS